MNKTWKAVLGVILIYLFGCFSGAVSTSIFFHHKMLAFLQHPAVALSAALEKRLTGNLGLDANQKQQIHQCFLDNLEKRKELQKQIQPQVQALNQQTKQQIVAILNPDQKELFDQNVEKLKKRFATNTSDTNADVQPAPAGSPPGPATPATNAGAGTPP